MSCVLEATPIVDEGTRPDMVDNAAAPFGMSAALLALAD